jgi:hypothetical protein
MGAYEVDPNLPCGARCQIKRAMQAWGGLIKVDPDKLLHKYHRMAANKAAIGSMQKMSIDIEQRLSAAEREASSKDSARLQKMRAHLHKSHAQIKKLVAAMVRSPNVKRSQTMKVAHALDVAHVVMGNVEKMAASEKAIRAQQAKVNDLGSALTRVQKSMRADANAPVKALLVKLQNSHKAVAQRLSAAAHSVQGKKQLASLNKHVTKMQAGVSKLKRMRNSDKELEMLQNQHKALSQEIAQIVKRSKNTNAPGEAVSLEKLRKAAFYADKDLGETLLTGDANDKQNLQGIQDHISLEARLLEAHKYAAHHAHQANRIKASLAAVEAKLAETSTDGVEEDLKKLKATHQDEQPTLGESNENKSASQLASEVDDMLLKAHQHTINVQKMRIKHELRAQKLKKRLAALSMKKGDAELDSQFLDSKLSELKTGMKGLHKTVQMTLGEVKESPTELSKDIDSMLQPGQDTAEPPLDIAEEIIPLQDDAFLQEGAETEVPSVSNTKHKEALVEIPFVSNKKANEAFNEHPFQKPSSKAKKKHSKSRSTAR